MRRWRIGLASAGIVLALYGVVRIVTQVPTGSVLLLVGWLVGVVAIHDGLLSPLIVAIGVLVARVPPRARRSLQSALVVGAIVTSIALPLIARRGTQPAAKALLLRDYGGSLALLLGVIAAASLVQYAVRVAIQWKP